ncbi:MAG TPA: pyruvate dehydrogenase (acetyl-transferring) E1 component subunit alpha [Candidatus Nanoarchaeia archaeon]|nr:pyruvate dehydrogenase (acetyl-transferring) E1 component subunit alpha [Candidatus Nanoarchaeia archaeon]
MARQKKAGDKGKQYSNNHYKNNNHKNNHYLQILNERGEIVDAKIEPKISREELKRMYALMILARTFDDKALKIQRQGRIGTYLPVRGQEACQIGSAILMKKSDWMFPAFREHAAYFTRGMPIKNYLYYWMGYEEGGKIPEDQNNFTISIPVGSQLVHAVGVAMASRIKGENIASVVYFGDGATSEGEFHEALNFAGLFKAPVVFICQNNQWAISTPRKKQTASKTIAQKASAYGFEGIQVDGNDILAVYSATREALKKAYSGKGPVLIECITYRMGVHSTSDDTAKYRSEAEAVEWEKKDPIQRFEAYLKSRKILNDAEIKKIREDAENEVNSAVVEAEKFQQNPLDMFDYVYAESTKNLAEQKEELKGYLDNLGNPKK